MKRFTLKFKRTIRTLISTLASLVLLCGLCTAMLGIFSSKTYAIGQYQNELVYVTEKNNTPYQNSLKYFQKD